MVSLVGGAPPTAARTSAGHEAAPGTRPGQFAEHHRRAAQVGDRVPGDQVQGPVRLEGGQADAGGPDRGHAPGQRPAVAVEHRQRPQMPARRGQAELQGHAHRVEIRAAMGVDHALGPSRGPAGVVHRDHGVLVAGQHDPVAITARQPLGVRQRAGQQRVPISGPGRVLGGGQQHHRLHRQFARGRYAQRGQQGRGQQQDPGPRVSQDVPVLRGGQPGVEGDERGARTGHAVVGGQQPPGVQVEHGDPVTGADAARPQRAGHRGTVPAERLVADLGAVAVHDGDLAGEGPAGPGQEGQRGQWHMVGQAQLQPPPISRPAARPSGRSTHAKGRRPGKSMNAIQLGRRKGGA